jgi:hypothetical protein
VIEFKNGKLVTNEVLDGSQLSLEKICFISDKRNLIPDIISNNTEKKSTSFFLRETLDDFLLSVKEIKELIGTRDILLEVDGGINNNTINLVKDANIAVVGSYITKSTDPVSQINSLLV